MNRVFVWKTLGKCWTITSGFELIQFLKCRISTVGFVEIFVDGHVILGDGLCLCLGTQLSKIAPREFYQPRLFVTKYLIWKGTHPTILNPPLTGVELVKGRAKSDFNSRFLAASDAHEDRTFFRRG